MTEFIVAGAGHGGLTAAFHLAKAGRQVTVIERLPEAELGYDWTDVVDTGALERNGFSPLPESSKATAHKGTLIGPSKSAPLRPTGTRSKEIHAERKEWLAILVGDCRSAGVDFMFETEILGPAVEGDRVCGLRVRTDEGEQTLTAGMVVDAAGAQSVVRTNLPAHLGIPGMLRQDQLFYGWRGYFNRLPGPDPQDVYKQYLVHQGRPGLSWVITDPDCMDVIVGNIGGPLDDTALADAIADLRQDNPLLGEQLLRGGGVQPSIPVRRPLGLFVANGYAAAGDSACMADPFSGCGICAAMDQGKLLADILLKCDGDYSLPRLWEYQYRTFMGSPPAEGGDAKKTTAQRAMTDVMRCVMMTLRPEEIDLMFERGLIALRDGIKRPKDALLLLRGLDHPKLLWKLAKIPLLGKKIREIVLRMPENYDPAAVAAWVKDYEGCKMC